MTPYGSPSPAPGPVLVTGATGTTGSRLVVRLLRAGHPVRAAGRRAAPVAGAEPVAFDWSAPATHDAALDGAAALYLVPPPGATDPADVMLPFLDRARRAGVRRAVLLSSSLVPAGGPATGQVHRALPGHFPEWAVLRPSWFMQNVTGGHPHARSIRGDGVLTTATGRGRVAFIDADDIAAVAAHALTDPVPHNTDWVLTGPQALSYDEVAALVSHVAGRPVRHRAVSGAELRARYARDLPDAFAAFLAELDLRIAGGAEDRVTDSVARVTGRPPTSFAAYLRANAALFEAG
ncbi:NAD(P)H-binding protein [Streptomyces sp. RS10V-4]|uniref:NAD(P)H-binding protein n=1 Tax=Streptomyces rhizoryzae TaxID=2932493 RepID=UPI0020056B2C|nr:NAD(P)H-binding protein [Streptomyces rhizoryzae]MCK7622468.1 NAD(P)H-binding protein [Streptomyces rhizoryzae]